MVEIRVRILQEGLWQLIRSTGSMENRTWMVQKKWKGVSSGSNVTREKRHRKDKKGLAETISSPQNTIFHCDYTGLFSHSTDRIVSVAKGVHLFTLTVSGSSASRRQHRISYSALVKLQKFTDSYWPYFTFIAGPTGKWTVYQGAQGCDGLFACFYVILIKTAGATSQHSLFSQLLNLMAVNVWSTSNKMDAMEGRWREIVFKPFQKTFSLPFSWPFLFYSKTLCYAGVIIWLTNLMLAFYFFQFSEQIEVFLTWTNHCFCSSK